MKASHLFKLLGTGGARRSGRARSPVQRLTGFEPLEPRTVLSAGLMMFGPGGFAEPHHGKFDGFDPPGRSKHDGGDYYSIPERQFMGGERYSPHEASIVIPRNTAPVNGGPPAPSAMESPALTPITAPINAPTSGQSSVETKLSPALPLVTPYVSKAPETATQVVIIRSLPAPRVTAEAVSNQILSVSEYRPVVSVPLITITFAERRVESQPSVSIAALREATSYVGQARLNSSSAATVEAEASGASAEHGLAPRTVSSPVLAQLSLAQTTSPDRYESSISDDSGRLEEQSDQTAKPRDDAEGDGELVEIGSGDLVRQKRKTALADAATGAPISTRLERLADIPFSADAQSFFRELALLVDSSPAGASWLSEQSAATATPDDGLIELLAADIGSLMLPPTSLPAGAPVGATVRATGLEPGVALYQAFEVASGDAASENAAGSQVAERPAADPIQQLARAD